MSRPLSDLDNTFISNSCGSLNECEQFGKMFELISHAPFNTHFPRKTILNIWESRDAVVGRALASHHCDTGFDSPNRPLSCGSSLLLVLFSAPRLFSPGTPVFPFLKTNTSKFQFDPE